MATNRRSILRRLARHWLVVAALAILPTHVWADSDVFPCVIGDQFFNTSGFFNYGMVGGIHAFSLEVKACNQGDTFANWIEETNQHPVITQNLLRLRNGRFEQIGQAWLKHGFFVAAEDGCTLCSGEEDFTKLGPGCCDTYGASLNGFQSILGPKSEVNASTGVFPYPFCGGGCPAAGNGIDRRLQVADADLDINQTVIYITEMQYVLQDDCQANPRTDYNNASYRRIGINSSKQMSFWLSATMPGEPGINAWAAYEAGVTSGVVDVPGDGRFHVSAKATDLGGGTWHYEYAVQNLNSDRSGASFSVPIPIGATISNVGFHDIFYHSGEPYDPTDWSMPANGVTTGNALTWASQAYLIDPPNANALRWGTLYNFRFDANVPPDTGVATIGLFKPGSPTTASLGTVTPRFCVCTGDLNGDGKLDGLDVPAFVQAYLGITPTNCADVASPSGSTPDDADLAQVVSLLLGTGTCP
ncbi:MAG: hypothetical protein AABZ08_05720 [Planctomycetota bacterium]